jgi:hypothetical protein
VQKIGGFRKGGAGIIFKTSPLLTLTPPPPNLNCLDNKDRRPYTYICGCIACLLHILTLIKLNSLQNYFVLLTNTIKLSFYLIMAIEYPTYFVVYNLFLFCIPYYYVHLIYCYLI